MTQVPKHQVEPRKEERIINKGDKVSVLGEAVNGIVIATKGEEVTIETDGFVTAFCPSRCQIHDTSNLMDSIRRIIR
jgi:hypothetical protein